MWTELLFGDPTLKRERGRRCLPEDVRKTIRFDVQASLGRQSVSKPGPVIQERGFATFGPVVDCIERQRRIRQHAPLQGEVTVPGPLVGQLLQISSQTRIPERLFSLDPPIEEGVPLFQVRLIGRTDPLVATMLNEQPLVRLVMWAEFRPIHGNRRAQPILGEGA